MKNFMRFKNLSLAILVIAAFSGCVKKDDYYKKNSDEANRKQVVQIYGGGPDAIIVARDGIPPLDTFVLVDLRRYPNKEADLNQPLTVKLQLKLSLISDYDSANHAAVVQLPLAAYTLSENITSVTFQPGEGQKQIKIRLDKNQLDLSKQYGIGFTIVDAGSNSVINPNQRDALYIIGVKNKYDGIYHMVGHHNRSPYNFPYDVTMYLTTSGPSSVNFYWPDVGGFGHPIGVGPDPINDVSWYGGGIQPALTFNPTTDVVTSAYNVVGTPPIVLYTGATAPVSRYDAATKTVYAYFYYFTGAGQDFSNRGWNDTLIYVGPR